MHWHIGSIMIVAFLGRAGIFDDDTVFLGSSDTAVSLSPWQPEEACRYQS